MFWNFFSKKSRDKGKEDKERDDVVAFARTIERLIDETSLELFKIYKKTLLAEPNVYIVPAIWGAVKDGELTEIQKQIHSGVSPVIKKILDLLEQERMSPAQQFAVGYLVRGLFISKVIYMIEFYKNLSGNRLEIEEQKHDGKERNLKDIEPMGHA
jgi:predicted transcriptional regulator